MTEKRYTVEMAIYKRREGSSNIGVNYIRDNYSKNNKMVKCCGRNYVDVEVPESAIVFGDTNRHIVNKVCERLNDLNNKNEQLKQSEKDCQEWNHKLINENEQLKKEKEFWKGNACNCSNYLSILSMDCQIIQEAICDLKNVIDVDTEASKLLDKLDDKFDELNQHRIKIKYSR